MKVSQLFIISGLILIAAFVLQSALDEGQPPLLGPPGAADAAFDGAGAAGRVTGLQVGYLGNVVQESLSGVQIGAFNFANELHGLQIGLLNFNKSGPLPFFPILNFAF